MEKKHDVPVNLATQHYALLVQYGDQHDLTDPVAAHDVLMKAASSDDVLSQFAPYLKRTLLLGDHALIGYPDNPDYRHLYTWQSTFTKRVHVKLSHQEWLQVSDIAHALAAPLNHTVCLLLSKYVELALASIS